MKRRGFLSAAGSTGFLTMTSCGNTDLPWNHGEESKPEPPDILAGTTLENLREDYRHRLFDLYLPFWDKGGYDGTSGGFFTCLHDDGTVKETVKRLADQGNGLWLYSHLYNEMGEDEQHLDIATRTHDFLINKMYLGNGAWNDAVDGTNNPVTLNRPSVMNRFPVVRGLIEFQRITGDDSDEDILFETLWAALRDYDGLSYPGIPDYGGMNRDIELIGLRELAHTSTLLSLLTDYLERNKNRRLEEVLNEQISNLMNKFFNPNLGILNTYLDHNYSRISGYEDYMQTGTGIKAACALIREAKRSHDKTLHTDAKNMFDRFLELGYDYVFEGYADGHYYVFDGPDRTRDMLYSEKTLRTHCLIQSTLLESFEETGDGWSKNWYERIRLYILEKFADIGQVWPNTIDRFGRIPTADSTDKQRDIYHQPRHLITDLLTIDRMLDNLGRLDDLGTTI